MYRAEAMWLGFHSLSNFERWIALELGSGRINAVTGLEWTTSLARDLRDYVVIPGQTWRDGSCAGKGVIGPFVVAPLDRGMTVAEQLTGGSAWAGVQ